jgi:hypothetical protein
LRPRWLSSGAAGFPDRPVERRNDEREHGDAAQASTPFRTPEGDLLEIPSSRPWWKSRVAPRALATMTRPAWARRDASGSY